MATDTPVETDTQDPLTPKQFADVLRRAAKVAERGLHEVEWADLDCELEVLGSVYLGKDRDEGIVLVLGLG